MKRIQIISLEADFPSHEEVRRPGYQNGMPSIQTFPISSPNTRYPQLGARFITFISLPSLYLSPHHHIKCK